MYTAGLKVTTTIDSRLQRTADEALRKTLIDYDERHGYRGPLGRAPAEFFATQAADATESLPGGAIPPDGADPEFAWRALLADYEPLAGYRTGLVLSVEPVHGHDSPSPRDTSDETGALNPQSIAAVSDRDDAPEPEFRATVYFSDLGRVPVQLQSVRWAAPYIDDNRTGNAPQSVADVLATGNIVRFRETAGGELRLGQLPEAQGAMVALDPIDGAVTALSGGFDFFLSNFNRVTQSRRQPGSAFKPFVYSAALERGFTAASVFNDAPIVELSSELEGYWRPTNYSEGFNGPTRLREALIKSLNLVSVRVIQQAGIPQTVEYVRRFGFDALAAPMNPSMALGAGGVAPLNLAGGYAAFANGGYRVEPYIIEKVQDAAGDTLYAASPPLACPNCEEPEPVEERLLQSVADIYGTRAPAPRRGRHTERVSDERHALGRGPAGNRCPRVS